MNRWSSVSRWGATESKRYHASMMSFYNPTQKQLNHRCCRSLARLTTATRQNVKKLCGGSSKIKLSLRCLSSSSSSSTTATTPSQDSILLYERDSTWQRNFLPWANVAVITTLVSFFVWHAFEYIPRYNRMSRKEKERSRSKLMLETMGNDLDPSGDYAVLLFGAIHLYASMIYARRLVSRMVLTKKRELLIWTHRWPLFKPGTTAYKYQLGEVGMNSNRSDMQKILNKLDGNIHWYRGHLGIFHQTIDGSYPYFLSIKKEHEVKEPEILLHAMVNPGFLTQRNFRQTFKSQTPVKTSGRKR